MNGKIQSFLHNTPKLDQTPYVSSESSPHIEQPTSLCYSQDYYTLLKINLYTKIKKKLQKNKKILKKKAVTAVKLVAAGALLTAGGNIVDKLSEDTAPQISASEVTWNQDQGTALFKIETVQRDSGTMQQRNNGMQNVE